MSFAISLKGITKEYPGTMALNGVDLQVKTGTIHGFIGPNGAGKSTTMNIIAGLIPPTAGEVYVDGEDSLKNPNVSKGKIGLLPERPPLYQNMRVSDYLKFCQNINWTGPNDKTIKGDVVEKIMRRCGLIDVGYRLIGNLSKGYRQRVGMAQALVFGAKIIILDEPTVGLDPNSISEIRNLIVELKQDHTILLSTHQLHEVARICDEVTIIDKGKILRTGPLVSVQSEFSAFRTFEALVKKSTDNLKKELMSKSYVQGVDFLHQSGEELLRIRVQGKDDVRGDLTSLLAKNAILLEFKEMKMELEEIFREVVK